MCEWIFDKTGRATLILDTDCIRNNHGQMVAWISENNVFDLAGHHRGWFEDGVLADSRNHVLGFLRDATGHLPSRPGLGGTLGMPGFTGRPGRPGFSGVPGRPGRGGWSSEALATYF